MAMNKRGLSKKLIYGLVIQISLIIIGGYIYYQQAQIHHGGSISVFEVLFFTLAIVIVVTQFLISFIKNKSDSN